MLVLSTLILGMYYFGSDNSRQVSPNSLLSVDRYKRSCENVLVDEFRDRQYYLGVGGLVLAILQVSFTSLHANII